MTINHVNRYTRAGNNGKTIECPKCHNHVHVFHFSWSAIGCTICGESVNKEDWIIEKTVQKGEPLKCPDSEGNF